MDGGKEEEARQPRAPCGAQARRWGRGCFLVGRPGPCRRGVVVVSLRRAARPGVPAASSPPASSSSSSFIWCCCCCLVILSSSWCCCFVLCCCGVAAAADRAPGLAHPRTVKCPMGCLNYGPEKHVLMWSARPFCLTAHPFQTTAAMGASACGPRVCSGPPLNYGSGGRV